MVVQVSHFLGGQDKIYMSEMKEIRSLIDYQFRKKQRFAHGITKTNSY